MSFFRLNAGTSRIFGLDLLRFFAIMFVVIGHSMILMPKEYKLPFEILILDGVAIFFVLSGFLIGGILIRLLEKQKPTFGLLLNFWNRRWLRTLPMYFLVLIVLMVFTFLMKPDKIPADLYKYVFFLQNFAQPQPSFFSESWSLSIEEWFYLLIPLLLFSGLFIFRTRVRTMFIWVICLVVTSIIIYRFIVFDSAEIATLKEGNHFLMQVLTRLDSIMYGVLAAFVAFYFPKVWEKANSIYLVLSGIAILYIMKLHLGVYFIVWLPAFKSIAVMIMLPFLSNWKTFNSGISRFVTFISLISYSMYLINLNVVIYVIIKFGLNGNLRHKHVIESDWPFEYLFYWVLTIGLSFLLYKFVEVPFMNLRKKEK